MQATTLGPPLCTLATRFEPLADSSKQPLNPLILHHDTFSESDETYAVLLHPQSNLLKKRALYNDMDVDEEEASFSYKRPRYESVLSNTPSYPQEDHLLPLINKKRKITSGDGTDEEEEELNPSLVGVAFDTSNKRYKPTTSSPPPKLANPQVPIVVSKH
jgi:hypothetical protein